MKIAFMIRNLNEKGGINVYTVNLIENILNLDKKNEYLFIYSNTDFFGRFSSFSNVKEVVVKSKSKLIWDQMLVPRVLRKEKVDLVFNPKLSIPLFTKAKKLLMIHGAEQYAVKEAYPLYDQIYVRIAVPLYGRFASKILTTTKLGTIDLSRYLKINLNKFVFSHEGVNKRFRVWTEEERNAVKEKYQLPNNFILFVGGLFPIKNFTRVAKAIELLNEKSDYRLIAVGFKRHKFESDLKAAQNLVDKGKIVFTGFVPDEDLPGFYNLAKLLIFPSLYEGFGLPVLEAMACGCPVITSIHGCTKEVTGEAAVLVDPYDVKQIAEKMGEFANDDDKREDLRQKGFKRVKDFSWEKCARETLEIFRSIGAS